MNTEEKDITIRKGDSKIDFNYKPYDMPFFEEVLDFCISSGAVYVSPIHILQCIFRYPTFRHFLKIEFEMNEFRLFKLDIFLKEYASKFIGKPLKFSSKDCLNTDNVAVPFWALDRLSVYYEDYVDNFKRRVKGADYLTFGLLLSSILDTQFEEELNPICEEVFYCSFRAMVSKVVLGEETLGQHLLPIAISQYNEICLIRHYMFNDSEVIDQLDMDYGCSHNSDYVEFRLMDNTEICISTSELAGALGYFSQVLSGLVAFTQDSTKYQLGVTVLPSILNGSYGANVPPIVNPCFASDWYGIDLTSLNLLDESYYAYQFTGDDWCSLFDIVNISKNDTEDCLRKISGLYDNLYGPITMYELLTNLSTPGANKKIPSPPMEANMERKTAERVENGRAEGAQRTYKFGDYEATTDSINETLSLYIPNLNKYMQSAYLGINRQMKRSTLFIGPSGCGKTQFLKYMMVKNNLGEYPYLFDRKIQFVSVDIGALMSLANSFAEFNNSLRNLFARYEKTGRDTQTQHVFVMDQITRASNGNPLKPSSAIELLCNVSRTYNVPIIAACTEEEYTRLLKTNSEFDKTFEIVKFKDLTQTEAFNILLKKKAHYEAKYRLEIPDNVCHEIVRYAERFIRNKAFPEKAIALLDKICGIALLEPEYAGETYSNLFAVNQQSKMLSVSSEIVGAIMENDYNIPAMQLENNQLKSIKQLENNLKNHVFGQETAIEQFMRYWKKHQAGMVPKNKTIGSFLFIGPTGVGKTELAKQIAEFTGRKLLRFDMSEYSESYNTSKLIGSPNGYVGCDEGGLLTNAVSQNPNCVLLLDEIEKAHPTIHNILLQAMDNAELTSSRGEKVDFQNVVIIMTSNCGAREVSETKTLGFNSSTVDKSSVYDKELRSTFTPEFIGRFDGIIHFNELSDDTNRKIITYQFNEIVNRVTEQYINICDIRASRAFMESILTDIKDNKSGARGIVHALDTKVSEKLCDILLDIGETRGMVEDGGSTTMYSIHISLNKTGKVSFKVQGR